MGNHQVAAVCAVIGAAANTVFYVICERTAHAMLDTIVHLATQFALGLVVGFAVGILIEIALGIYFPGDTAA